MDWNASTVWWLLSGALVAAELATGTFYLLMLALGCAAGAVAGHLGLSTVAQVVAASVVGGATTVAWYLKRSRQPSAAPAASNRDVNLDIGQEVHVPAWAADGSARVQYRGASWSVRLADSSAPQPGPHTIVALHGSELVVAPVNPS